MRRRGDPMVERASRLKITVLKRFKPADLFEKLPAKGAPVEACGVYRNGLVFYVEADGRMPKGFCGWALDDIYKGVQTLRFHGNFHRFEEPGVSVSCCTEGLRLAVFKMERV